MAIVLHGAAITFSEANPIVDPGAVYIGDDGKIAAVKPAGEAEPAGFAAAHRVNTGGVIYPGLIDLHSHIAYNTLPLWSAPSVPYIHHDRWPDEDEYPRIITWPARVLQQAAAEALLKYVEVKALVGGTTSIQGAPRTTRPVDGWLVRIVDNERLGTTRDLIRVSALQKRPEQLRTEAQKLREGSVLIYHVAEGQIGSIVHREFADLQGAGCLQPGLIGVHATALGREDFAAWHGAASRSDSKKTSSIAWSPFSNLWLYEQTTGVVAAHEEGLRICLGSDWSPSGTKNVLGELKVADIVNKRMLGGAFTDRQICEMVTANPGDALAEAWGPRLGRLREGTEGDLVVMASRAADPYRNLIEATERDVQLVIVRGRAFYGTRAMMRKAGATGTNQITVAGERRAVLVRMPNRADASLSWAQAKAELNRVRKDPKAAWNASLDALAAWGGALDSPEAPLVIFGDMPEGDLGVMGATGEIPDGINVPPLDSLEHDETFLRRVEARGAPHLAELANYYR